MSRNHARIFLRPADDGREGGCYLEDLGSKHGLFIGGDRLVRKPLRLSDGVRVMIGRSGYEIVPADMMNLLKNAAQARPPQAKQLLAEEVQSRPSPARRTQARLPDAKDAKKRANLQDTEQTQAETSKMRGWSTFGSDEGESSPMLSKGRQLRKKVTFREAKAAAIEILSDRVDIVIASRAHSL